MTKSHATILKKLPVFLLALLFFVGGVAFGKPGPIVFPLESIHTDPLRHSTINQYDASGNLLTVTEGSDVLTRTYETDRDLVSTYTNAAEESIGYSYDANGNLVTLEYPGGRTVHYGYDANDQLVTVTDWNERQPAWLPASLLPDGRGTMH